MSKLQNMRAIEIPKFRAVSSGPDTLDNLFAENGFFSWLESHAQIIKRQIFDSADFMWHEDNDITKTVWIWAVNDDVTQADTAPYEIMEFPGGMFLVATADEKDNADLNETVNCMVNWINSSKVFTMGDYPVSGMCNMPNANGAIDNALGITQQQIFLPLKLQSEQIIETG